MKNLIFWCIIYPKIWKLRFFGPVWKYPLLENLSTFFLHFFWLLIITKMFSRFCLTKVRLDLAIRVYKKICRQVKVDARANIMSNIILELDLFCFERYSHEITFIMSRYVMATIPINISQFWNDPEIFFLHLRHSKFIMSYESKIKEKCHNMP